MYKLISYIRVSLLACLLGLPASCDTGPNTDLSSRFADSFFGGAAAGFSGPDSANAGATAEGADMVSGRNFDFTPSGFTLRSGNLGSQAPSEGDYSISGGTLDIDGGTATVDLDVASANPDVTGVDLVGTFSLAEASGAIANPGRTFDVTWDVSFSYLGFPVSFSMVQPMTGSDFIEQ